MRVALAAALALTVVATTADARRLRCPGAFATSCVRALYRGFVATGACTRDVSRLPFEGVITDCWANGARASVSGFATGEGTSSLVDRRGRTLRTGTTVVGGNAITIRYQRGRRTWTIARAGDGGFTVTCPDGAIEQYTAAQVTAGGCGPIADCPLGSCS